MFNVTGNLVLNGLEDADLVKLLQIKMRHEQFLNYSPQQMQPQRQQTPQGGREWYNNVTLGWNGEQGLVAVQEAIEILLRKEDAKAQAQ